MYEAICNVYGHSYFLYANEMPLGKSYQKLKVRNSSM